jgi:uncharacterized protein YfiM (DUF2279 family)
VLVELSRDGGASYATLAPAAPNSGSFSWTVAGPAASSALVRVSWDAGAAVAVSARFAIVAGAVTVTSPNSGVNWAVGTSHTISWTHNFGAGAQFRIDISRNGGSTWSPIAAAVTASGATTGSTVWVVSGPRTVKARVRVTWNGTPAVSDVSNVNFTIH